MKKKLFIFLPLFIITALLSPANAQDNLSDFQLKWKNAAAYTIEIAASMPEEHYDYRPVEEVRTFKEQLLHMMQNMVWLSSTYLSNNKFDEDLGLETAEYSKARILELLEKSFAFSSAAIAGLEPHDLRMKVKFFSGPMNIGQILTLLNDHLTHHRGQIIVYLRLNGIVPVRYVGW